MRIYDFKPNKKESKEQIFPHCFVTDMLHLLMGMHLLRDMSAPIGKIFSPSCSKEEKFGHNAQRNREKDIFPSEHNFENDLVPSKTQSLFSTMVSFSSTVLSVLGAATLVSAADVITLGTRPYYLVDEMKESALKDKLGEFVDI